MRSPMLDALGQKALATFMETLATTQFSVPALMHFLTARAQTKNLSNTALLSVATATAAVVSALDEAAVSCLSEPEP